MDMQHTEINGRENVARLVHKNLAASDIEIKEAQTIDEIIYDRDVQSIKSPFASRRREYAARRKNRATGRSSL